MNDGVYWGTGEFEGKVWDGQTWRVPTAFERSAHGPAQETELTSWQASLLHDVNKTARDVSTIKTIVLIYFVLSLIGAGIVGLAVLNAMTTSSTGY